MRLETCIILLVASVCGGCAYDRYTETLYFGGDLSVTLTADDGDVLIDETFSDGSASQLNCDVALIQSQVYESGPRFEGLYLCREGVPVVSECWDQGELSVTIENGAVDLHMDSGDLADHPDKSVHASFQADPEFGMTGSVSADAVPTGDCLDTERTYVLSVDWAFTEESSDRVRVKEPRDRW